MLKLLISKHKLGINRLCCATVIVWGLLFLASAPVTFADIPKYITFQGRLSDVGGALVAEGTYTLTFRLYDTMSAGSAVWTEQQTVTVTNGIFNVSLGTVTPLNLLFDTEYWLGVQVNGDVEMSPRQRLTSAGYAINAGTLQSYTSGQFLRSDVNDTATGQITLTYPGSALVFQPSRAPAADTKLIDLQDAAGRSKFTIDYEGDLISQNANFLGALDVSGATRLSGTTTLKGPLAVGANIFTVDTATGRIGIGTTAPTKMLDITGDANILGNMTVGTEAIPKDIFLRGNLNVSGDQIIEGTTRYTGDLVIGSDGAGYGVKFYSDTIGEYLSWDNNYGKMSLVGGSGLDVSGGLNVAGAADLGEVDIQGPVQIAGGVTIGSENATSELTIYGIMHAPAITDGTATLTGGTINAATWAGNIIGPQYGGTGANLANFSGGSLLYYSDSGAVAAIAPASITGKLLQSSATGAPTWATFSGGEDITNVGTITTGTWRGSIIEGAYGGTGKDTSTWSGLPKIDSGTWSNISAGGSGRILYDTGTTWEAASADAGGLVDKTSSQTIAGAKTFSDEFTLNNRLNVGGDVDVSGIAYFKEVRLADNEKIKLGTNQNAHLYVDSNNDLCIANVNQDKDIYFQINRSGTTAPALFIEAETSRVGIGTTSPSANLEIATPGGSRIEFDTSNPDYVIMRVDGKDVVRIIP